MRPWRAQRRQGRGGSPGRTRQPRSLRSSTMRPPAGRAPASSRVHRLATGRTDRPAVARRSVVRARARCRTRSLRNGRAQYQGPPHPLRPLADQPLAALDRLAQRGKLHGPRRLRLLQRRRRQPRPVRAPQALRRRSRQRRAPAAPIPRPAPHRRHLLTRVLDPVTVKDVLGHADLKTTERHLHAVRASRLAYAATRAFAPQGATECAEADNAELLAVIERLSPEERRRALASIR